MFVRLAFVPIAQCSPSFCSRYFSSELLFQHMTLSVFIIIITIIVVVVVVVVITRTTTTMIMKSK